MIFTAMYIYNTAVGSQQIVGVQGRYFIPLSPVICLLFLPSSQRKSVYWALKKYVFDSIHGVFSLIPIYVWIGLVITVVSVIKRYYVE